MITAFMRETVIKKKRLLGVSLKGVNSGRGVSGPDAPPRHYFRTSAAGLAPSQAARLAVMLPNPRYYDKRGVTNYLARRTNAIQRQMRFAELP